MTKNIEKGISLLEILVVITIFAVLGILITRSIILTLQGSQKSASLVHARENLDYSLSIIERQIRGASSVCGDSSCTTPCPNDPNSNTIYYKDQNGAKSSFSCQDMGTDNSFIASGSAHLTSDAVKITTCSFTCTLSSGSNQPVVAIDLSMQDTSSSGIEGANVSASTQVYLRNY